MKGMKSEEDIRAAIDRFIASRGRAEDIVKEYDWILGRKEDRYWIALVSYIELTEKINGLKWVLGEEPLKRVQYVPYWSKKKHKA